MNKAQSQIKSLIENRLVGMNIQAGVKCNSYDNDTRHEVVVVLNKPNARIVKKLCAEFAKYQKFIYDSVNHDIIDNRRSDLPQIDCVAIID